MCRELKNLRSSGVRSFVRSLFVCDAVIKAIWTFSKFSLILLWKGFGGVTHRPLLDPKFGRFTSKFVDFLDQKWDPKMDSFRHARRATLPCGCNLVVRDRVLDSDGAPDAPEPYGSTDDAADDTKPPDDAGGMVTFCKVGNLLDA